MKAQRAHRQDMCSMPAMPERALPLRPGRCEISRQLIARIVAEGLAVPHFRRSPPARLDAGHVGQFMCDALVTIDAGLLPADEKLAVDVSRASGLLGEVH